MNKRNAHLMPPRLRYVISHPLIGDNVVFSSWVELCESCVDAAIEEATESLQSEIMRLADKIADEILRCVEEIEDT